MYFLNIINLLPKETSICTCGINLVIVCKIFMALLVQIILYCRLKLLNLKDNENS